jgi:hypothetical protein
MEVPLKELAKLERLTGLGGKPPSIPDALESLLFSLQEVKDRISEVAVDEASLRNLVRAMESRKKEVDERQKEVYSSVARLGKALDKVSPLFRRQVSVLTSMHRNSQLLYHLTQISFNLPLLWRPLRGPSLYISYGLGNLTPPKLFCRYVENSPRYSFLSQPRNLKSKFLPSYGPNS